MENMIIYAERLFASWDTYTDYNQNSEDTEEQRLIANAKAEVVLDNIALLFHTNFDGDLREYIGAEMNKRVPMTAEGMLGIDNAFMISGADHASKKMVIDMTPSWDSLVEPLLQLFDEGKPDKIKEVKLHFHHMASVADEYVSIVKQQKDLSERIRICFDQQRKIASHVSYAKEHA